MPESFGAFLAEVAAIGWSITLWVLGRRFWPGCEAAKDLPRHRDVSILCRRRRFHVGVHRTGPRSKVSTAFWRRDSLWQARRHPVRWWHRQAALRLARSAP